MESSTGEPTVPDPAESADQEPTAEVVPVAEQAATAEVAPVAEQPLASAQEPTPDVVEPVAEQPVAAPVTSLSLDDVTPAAFAVPDLDAVAPTLPTSAPPTDPEPVGFDLGGDSGYAESLARQTYGQPAPVQPEPVASYQQPAPPSAPYVTADPFAAQSPYTQNPYAQTPYAQNPYASAAQSPYAQNPYTEQHPYAPVPYVAPASDALTPDQERTWASAAHWSALAASAVGLGFLGPLLVYLIQGPKSAWVKSQAAESLNFELTFIISMIASFVAMLVVVGFVTVFVFPVIWLIFRIIATVATAQGRDYRYPINIRMVK
jgi:uncharacterized protein